MECKLAIGRAV